MPSLPFLDLLTLDWSYQLLQVLKKARLLSLPVCSLALQVEVLATPLLHRPWAWAFATLFPR